MTRKWNQLKIWLTSDELKCTVLYIKWPVKMSSQSWRIFLVAIFVLSSSKMNYVTKCFALQLNFWAILLCVFFRVSVYLLCLKLCFDSFGLSSIFRCATFSLLSHSLLVIGPFHQFRTSCNVKWVHRNKNWPAFCSFVPCDNDDDYGKTLWNVLVWSLAFFLRPFILLCIFYISVCMEECACRKTASFSPTPKKFQRKLHETNRWW